MSHWTLVLRSDTYYNVAKRTRNLQQPRKTYWPLKRLDKSLKRGDLKRSKTLLSKRDSVTVALQCIIVLRYVVDTHLWDKHKGEKKAIYYNITNVYFVMKYAYLIFL